ncbi:MAG: alkaline phosphatase family protein [Coriobacteriia bacterium]|nr:alkaline phosphatase family protein [Coriobacteriia bacterium]
MADKGASRVLWVSFVLGTLVCLGVAYGAYTLAAYSWAQVVNYNSPYVSADPPEGLVSVEPTPSAPMVRRVVLVIVDGLREDVSRSSMPTLNTMRTYASDISLTVPQPSLSFPNWTTILTGASPPISGVTTNWHSGRQLAPTLIDTVNASGGKAIVVGPTDFTGLFGIQPGPRVSLRSWPKGGYLSGQLVDDALRLSKESTTSSLIVLHLPDVDEAGHEFGGGSAQYRQTASKVDADIARLVAGLQSPGTTFVIVADHGHTATGGHGGWEPEVLQVPGIFVGDSVRLGTGTGTLDQVAPTISVLLGLTPPAYAEAQALRSVVATDDEAVFGADVAHHLAFDAHYIGVVRGVVPTNEQLLAGDGADANVQLATQDRLAAERNDRVWMVLLAGAAALVVICVIGIASWRALVAAGVGAAVYYAAYELLFFVVHGYRWSLSAFNTETYVKVFMNWRLGEAAFCALLGVAVAALLYPYLRANPKGPRDPEYLPGHLSLAPATLLLVLATLGVQVGWYLWQWGATITWTLPDFMWAFKADLDMVQMTAVGAAALLAPLVTYLIGRYHPRVRRTA